ncbi:MULTISPECIES: pyruvate dehydrogenase (acetyl-transferring) E1 component subunit alpha [Croceibacter]|jgi:pyruvate dehydrogenase E1 component alpha subunit|uniref:Pyruvate dehydrogenase E1 component subunit alpha n=1 Tax=Croceibacter atlanticus (strain ATCC BAA-628 / JCM 21780 / CIP 108009 / IAM 15332 / KCTC 12090 / HTCC2559) TaxID=216432 RepID=A3U7G3_CROAH|nr:MULTISPECIES: pyruvate dehydrogenase (acetyl-transferring) E1 component subunit alpha [Croceibacter]HAT69489.1 pyruvate dehydrogenase (acetyl-transferring) E1 component subunit alpha [Flavobacteriaceae bacterium]EAP88180.1 pyruvate dehydrogenase complex, E1 component, alpha subunit [Croceibacter atlanticus HTCC2559]MAM22575.1 pyruvate dehydrogenase (acetyl-transferring) E1 component subunit alpha [Croceibacter sp.]MBG24608.1 pyruvate dehydrogenase (acetyl-transferring) E1 component subunit a|tara:strand:+ start:1512 stop:2513 length:1002 start_codon:yes stop_codon:yes gene_type:complete
MKKITKATYLKWYEDMLFWRKFEDKLAQVYIQQKVRGFLHLYNGQEAILAGTLHAMDTDKDRLITAYRNHVQPIGMGVDPKRVMAELYGKGTGTSQGLGGSMHIFSKEHRFYGGHGIVGGQIPLGAGLAFADQYHDRDNVTITYFGDGAARQGSLHETFNLAMLWNLPVVFCVENNGYAMGTSVARTANHTDIWKLGLGYEMPCGPVDAMNPVKVAEAMSEAIERARTGGGPTFLELKTYRYRGHSMSDAQKYRTKDEVAEYQKIDPITQVKEIILDKKYATEDEVKEIDQRVKDLVKECEEFAENSDFPEKNVMYDVVYEQEDYPFLSHKPV